MKKACPRIVVAAPKSGSGKTAFTCALIELLASRGKQVAAFKVGPDYIDPMFHKQVLGVPSRNLDTFFLPGGEAAEQFALHAQTADIAVIEGVMGYFDGLSGTELAASTYDAACTVNAPVLLVIDAKGMSRSVIPLLKGFCAYEKEVAALVAALNLVGQASTTGLAQPAAAPTHIRGVILNRVSGMTAALLKDMIEKETGLAVCGYIPQTEQAEWGSRHLGLMQPSEIPAVREKIREFADVLEKTVDLDRILAIASEAEPLYVPEKSKEREAFTRKAEERVRVAVAYDEAFSFYYQDNLDLLREQGAELIFFSPLHDEQIPEADALLLGGGYPELHKEQLSQNKTMLESIRNAAERGMPVLAECGGFLYLQQSLDGYPMAGVLPGEGVMTDRLVRFGYVEVCGTKEEEGFLRSGESIRAHEFHYADSTANGEDCRAEKPSGRAWPCMVSTDRILAGFPHLYYRSDPDVPARFLAAAQRKTLR